jgi:hypothetical protein
MTLLFFAFLGDYSLVLWFAVLHPQAGTNPVAALVVSTLLFGGMLVCTAVLILRGCYEYWTLTEEGISGKKPFRKKTVIGLGEIEKVEKATVPALILGVYKSEAYVIYSGDSKITILLSKKNGYPELDGVLGEKTGK